MLAYLAEKSGLSPTSIFASMSLHLVSVISLLGLGSTSQLTPPVTNQPRTEVFEVALESLPEAPPSAAEELLVPTALAQVATVKPLNVSEVTTKPIARKIVRREAVTTQKTSPAFTTISDSTHTSTTAHVSQPGTSKTSPSQAQVMNLSSWINRHKFYPSDARRRGEEGTVLVRISLMDNGDLKSYQVVRSSGSHALDRAATEILKRSAPYPQELAAKIDHAEVPLVFSLSS